MSEGDYIYYEGYCGLDACDTDELLIITNMNIQEAVRHMTSGKRVSRADWEDSWLSISTDEKGFSYIHYYDIDTIEDPIMWMPFIDDLAADDWIVDQ